MKFTKKETLRDRLSYGTKVMVYEQGDITNLISFAEDTGPFLFGWQEAEIIGINGDMIDVKLMNWGGHHAQKVKGKTYLNKHQEEIQ